MNEVRRIESEADEIARVRAVMDSFPMPDFVTGYTVELSEFDDEPALSIKFLTTHRRPDTRDGYMAVGRELNELSKGAHRLLRHHYPERYPYFRFGDPTSATDQA